MRHDGEAVRLHLYVDERLAPPIIRRRARSTAGLTSAPVHDDLDVVLSVEYPSSELDRSEFDDALDVLSYYADRHYDELRALAVTAST